MNHEDMSVDVLRSRCAQMEIDESGVLTVFGHLHPKMDEAKAKLEKCGITPKAMLHAFDMGGVMEIGKPDCMHMYPCPAPSIVAWSCMFNKTIDNQASNLAYAERLALKMVNYMVYAECVYANLVNHLCYALANSNDPQHLNLLKCKTNMESIARNCILKSKIKFLECNLPDIPDALDITKAFDRDLRNMIAHGNFAGNLPPHPPQLKLKHQAVSTSVYVRRQYKQAWEWDKKPVDLDAAYERMRYTTRIWHAALWHYWNIACGFWSLFPEPWQTQTGAHYPPDRSCEQTMW